MALMQPLQDWVQTRDMALAGAPLASPTAMGQEAHRIYSQKQKDWEELMQLSAFGEGYTDPDFDRARARAADILVSNGEELVHTTVGQMIANGVDQKQITDVLSRPFYVEPDKVDGYSLEQLSTENEVNEALEENPQLVEQESLETLTGQKMTDKADLITKAKIMSSMAAKLSSEWEEESFWEGAKQFAVDYSPLVDAIVNSFAASGEDESVWRKVGRAFKPGERQRELQEMYFDKTKDMTVEEMYNFVNLLNQNMKDRGFSTERRRRFFDVMSHGESWIENMNFGLGIFDANLARVGYNMVRKNFLDDALSKVSKKLATGNTKAATQEADDAIKSLAARAENLGENADEAISGAMDSAFQANKDAGSVAKKVEDTVEDKLASNRYEALKNSFISTDLKTTEEKIAEEEAIKRSLKKAVQNKATKGVAEIYDFNVETTEDGVRDIIAKIGTGKDGAEPFATEAAAQKFIDSTTLVPGEAEIVKNANGFYVYAKRPVTDLPVGIEEWTDQFKGVPILKHIFGSLWVPDEIREINLVAEGGARNLRNTIVKDVKQALKGVSKKELKNVQALITQGQIQEVWYDPQWIRETGAFSEKGIELYNLYRDISDTNYKFLNKHWRTALHNNGVRLIYDGAEGKQKYLGAVADTVEHPEKYIFKDTNTGHIYNLNEMSPEALEQLQQSGKKVVKLRSAVRDADGNIYQYIISNNVQVADLPEYVVPYVAGGTRYYPKGTVFIKQANIVSKDGVDSLFRSRTLGAHLNKKEALQQAKEVNDALKLYRSHLAGEITREEFGALINEQTAANRFFKASSADDFERFIRSDKNPTGWLDHRFDLEVLEDGQASSIYTRMKAKGAIAMEEDITNLTEDTFDLMRDYTGSYIMHRSDMPLKDVFGNYATTLNFVDSLQKTADRTAELAVTKPWIASWARYVRKYFGDIINPDDLARMSDKDLILYSRTLPNPSNDLAMAKKLDAFKYARHKFEIVAKTPTAYDRWLKTHMKWLADGLGDSAWAEKIGLFQRGTKSYEWLLKLDPVSFSRAVAYQMYMGFFSPRQLWLQGMGAKTVVDLEPINAAKALASYMPVSAAVMTKDAAKLSFLRKAAGKLGLNATEFDSMVDYLRQTGVRSGIERAYTGYAGYGTALEQASTFTARAGEGFNQMLGHQTAFHKFKKELLSATTKEAKDAVKRKMAGYADTLTLHMNRVNDTTFQRTPGVNIFSQFQNWGIRNFEVLADKNLSVAQKARLELSNLLFFGVDGTLGTHTGFWVYDMLHEDAGWSPEAAQFVETATTGALLAPFGVNMTSAGPQMFELVEKVYDLMTGEGPDGLLNMAPSVQAMKSFVQGAPVLAQMLRTAFDLATCDNVDDETLYNNLYNLITKSQPSSLSRAEKALLALKTGYLINSRGDIVDANTDKTKAILYGLGFDTNTEAGTEYMYWKLGNNKKVVKEVMKSLKEDWRKFAMTGSQDACDEFWMKVQAYTTDTENVNPAITRELRKQINWLIKENPANSIQKRLSLSFWAKSKGYREFYDLIQKPTVTYE